MAKREHSRAYAVYCGNYDCPSRLAGKTFIVTEGFDLIDGEVWLCQQCRPKPVGPVVDVETELL